MSRLSEDYSTGEHITGNIPDDANVRNLAVVEVCGYVFSLMADMEGYDVVNIFGIIEEYEPYSSEQISGPDIYDIPARVCPHLTYAEISAIRLDLVTQEAKELKEIEDYADKVMAENRAKREEKAKQEEAA